MRQLHYTIKSTNPSSRATFLNVELFRIYRHMMYGRMPIGMGNALMRFHREKDEVLGDILGEDYWRGRSPLDAYPLPEPDLDCPKFNALHDAYVKEKEKAPLPPK